MKFIFTSLFVFTFFLQFFGQKSITKSEQLWFQYYNQIKLSNKLIVYSDFGIRFRSGIYNWFQITSRAGIGYPIQNKIQGISGFAVFTTFKDNLASIIELRPYQEVNTTHDFGKLKVQNRLRIEFRNFNILSSEPKVITSNFRFRYRLYFTYPLLDLSTKKSDSKLLLNIGDELFINVGKNILYNTFDNNRLLLGLGFQFKKKLTCSLTYCYQYGQRSKNLNEKSDIFWIGINHKLGFNK